QLDHDLLKLYLNIYPEMIKNGSPDYNSINGIFGNQARWYGLKQNEKLLAFCTIGILDDKVFLYNVGVDPNSRGRGFGSILLDCIIKKYGDKDIFLFVKKENRIAIKLYRKFNFEYI